MAFQRPKSSKLPIYLSVVTYNKWHFSLYALGRYTQKHPEWQGPSLGPKMSDENKRTFTDEQLRAHEGELNLQMGYNKGASQSGHGGEIFNGFFREFIFN